MAESWEEVEWIQAEIAIEELELKWSELVKKLLEIDDKFKSGSSENVQELAA